MQFALASNSTVCLGAVSPLETAPIVLGTCGTPGTTFEDFLNGAPSGRTRIPLADGLPELLCMFADPSGDVLLQGCEDSPFEFWQVTAGTGQIISTAEVDALCITAPVNGKKGSCKHWK